MRDAFGGLRCMCRRKMHFQAVYESGEQSDPRLIPFPSKTAPNLPCLVTFLILLSAQVQPLVQHTIMVLLLMPAFWPLCLSASLSFSSLRLATFTLKMSTTAGATAFEKPVVQYIFVRRDLDGWPQGAVAAQVAHASVAAVMEGNRAQDPATSFYTAEDHLGRMTKYVYGVDSLEELRQIQERWETKFGKSYHCWIEEPEHIPTALATWPVERTNAVSKLVKNLKVRFL